MMSLELIRQLSDEATREAQEANKRPLVCGEPEDFAELCRHIPNLGDYEPEGFERDEGLKMFVDSSGFGSRGGPALTQEAFIRRGEELIREHPGCGFGITQAGQFQVYVGVYLPV